jgi:hypothetical protein
MNSVSLLGCGLLVVSWAATAFAQDASKKEGLDPEFAAWYYPGATSPGSSTTLGKLHQVLLITADDLPQIEKFYRKATSHPLADALNEAKDPPPFGVHTSMGYPHPKSDKQIFTKWADDSKTKTDGPQRGVTLRTILYDTDDEFITVTISRTPTDKTTHILLVCLKKK